MADENAELKDIPLAPDQEREDSAAADKHAEDLAAFYKATGAPEATGDKTPQEQSGDDEPTDGTDGSEGSRADWELERARSVLVLDGAPRSTVEAMADEDVLEWYGRVKTRRDDTEQAFNERADLRRRLDTVNATSESAEGAPEAADATVAETIRPFVEELTSNLGEEVGAKAMDALTKAIAGSAKAVRDQVLTEVRQDTSQAISQATEVERARAAVRSRLTGEYPQLAEDSNWQEFERTASTLIKTGDYEGHPQDAWEHAARILQLQGHAGGTDAAEGMPVEDSETKPRKPKPTMTAPSRGTAPKSPTKEDEDRAIFNKVMARHGR